MLQTRQCKTSLTITTPGSYTTLFPTITISAAGAGTTEYASKIASNLVNTFADNIYQWFLTPHTIVAGQATIQSNM